MKSWCGGRERYRLNISEIISTSVSAAAIFSAEDSLGGPPKRKDMVIVVGCSGKKFFDYVFC